jgi:catechol 2,3-dioxygenase-like lactoylglutathione lyase family enzyme
MPNLERILETAIHVEDLSRSIRFYQDVLQLHVLVRDDRFCAFDVSGKSVLLLFRRGASVNPIELPGGVIPAHGGSGELHIAFAVAATELPIWVAHMESHGLEIESTVDWPLGGKSIYFRDPDQHLLELATPGVWATY